MNPKTENTHSIGVVKLTAQSRYSLGLTKGIYSIHYIKSIDSIESIKTTHPTFSISIVIPMGSDEPTTINVKKATKERFEQLGNVSMTQDELLNELIDSYVGIKAKKGRNGDGA